MQLKNTQNTYGLVAKLLHWGIALAVFGLLFSGLVMEDIPDKLTRFKVFGIHKAMGITVLGLMGLRLGWKLFNFGHPFHNSTHKPWEQKLASAIHWAFYALLLAMPLSGWLLTGAAGSTISWFGLFPIPAIAAPNPELKELYGEAHEAIATLIWLALGLHVGGALKHAVIDRDNTLRRMLHGLVLPLAFLPAVFCATFAPITANAADKETPTAWAINGQLSKLAFEAQQEGSSFKGEFKAFDGTINLSPETPETGNARILIDLGSVYSANQERDSTLAETDWFDTRTNPTAIYTIEKFEKAGNEGAYIARGKLQLRGVTRPLDLPFTLTTEETDGKKTAHATGKATLKRLDFGVGAGQWSDESTIGNAVTISIDITATAKPQGSQ